MQLPIRGVTVYLTIPGDVPVLVSVWAMFDPQAFVLQLEKPVIVPPAGAEVIAAVHRYKTVTPVIVVLSPIFVALPLQIIWVDGVAVTLGVGLTVTVTVKGLPVQSPDFGVTRYSTFCKVSELLVRVCEILLCAIG